MRPIFLEVGFFSPITPKKSLFIVPRGTMRKSKKLLLLLAHSAYLATPTYLPAYLPTPTYLRLPTYLPTYLLAAYLDYMYGLQQTHLLFMESTSSDITTVLLVGIAVD